MRDFNSHAHVERDFCFFRNRSCFLISTHTLTWSVTNSITITTPAIWISTHTLTWSVTPGKVFCQKCANISTHTLTWSVTNGPEDSEQFVTISTHTLTWSVTRSLKRTSQILRFQLTRSRGAWRYHHTAETWPFGFQLTRSRGAWQRGISQQGSRDIISTHTLTWSVTTTIIYICDFGKISTHTLTWSVTIRNQINVDYYSFQLTRSRGAWRGYCGRA